MQNIAHALTAIGISTLFLGKAWASPEVSATNCQAWVDKVAGLQKAYHSAYGAIIDTEVFIKIDLSQTGPIDMVGFYAEKSTFDDFGHLIAASEWQTYPLTPYFDAKDYYQINLGQLVDYSFNGKDHHHYYGAFFVNTLDGRRLWINSAYGNFRFDDSTYGLITRRRTDTVSGQSENEIYVAGRNPHGFASKRALVHISKTADIALDYNPFGCR